MIFTRSALQRFIRNQVLIELEAVPRDSIVAKHAEGTSEYNKGNYSSWTEWWDENIDEPLTPPNGICPCCQRIIKENKSNYFVVGHIYDAHTREGYVCPVCNQCNTGMKKWSFLVPRKLLHERPKNL